MFALVTWWVITVVMLAWMYRRLRDARPSVERLEHEVERAARSSR